MEKIELYPEGTSWSQRVQYTWAYTALFVVKSLQFSLRNSGTGLPLGISSFVTVLSSKGFPHTSRGAFLYLLGLIQGKGFEPTAEELVSGSFSYSSVKAENTTVAILYPPVYPLTECISQLSQDSPADLKCLICRSKNLEMVAVPLFDGWAVHFIGGVIKCKNWDELLLACSELGYVPNFAVYSSDRHPAKHLGRLTKEAKRVARTSEEALGKYAQLAELRAARGIVKSINESFVRAQLKEFIEDRLS